MGNSLYGDFNNTNEDFGISNIMQDINDMQKMLRQNPKDVVQGLLNSGQMSQQQFNQFSQMANKIRGMLPR